MTATGAAGAIGRWSPVITGVVVAIDTALLAAGVVTGRQALVLFLAVELPLIAATATAIGAAIRAHRHRGDSLTTAARRVLATFPLAPAVRAELRTYRALWLWAHGRRDVPPDGLALTAHRGTLALPAAFAIATLIELAALHLLVPWLWLQVTTAVVSVWSLLMLAGLVATGHTRPHYLTSTHLVLRHTGQQVAVIERDNIATLTRRRRYAPTSAAAADGRLTLPTPDGTCIDMTLRAPIPARLPALLPRSRTIQTVSRVSVHLDEPERILAAIKHSRRTT